MAYKNYFQRLLEDQTIYRDNRDVAWASPTEFGKIAEGSNLGTTGIIGEGTFYGDVWKDMSQMGMNPDLYDMDELAAMTDGPELNHQIQRIDSEFRRLYWDTEPMVAHNDFMASRLKSFAKAQENLYKSWMNALKGFVTGVGSMFVLRDKFQYLLNELVEFNASVR